MHHIVFESRQPAPYSNLSEIRACYNRSILAKARALRRLRYRSLAPSLAEHNQTYLTGDGLLRGRNGKENWGHELKRPEQIFDISVEFSQCNSLR